MIWVAWKLYNFVIYFMRQLLTLFMVSTRCQWMETFFFTTGGEGAKNLSVF